MGNGRERKILTELQQRAYRQADRMFAWIFLAQWAVAIGLALIISPWSYAGGERTVHAHVWLAVIGGGIINSLPLALIRFRPGWAGTRHSVAAVQMLWSAILIAITNGRIETHFHVFGSLAFLAFYRDWKVLPTATLVVVLDHVARGLWFPDSVYGLQNPEWWRFFEHATWVVFEDIVLVLACLRQSAEMRAAATREAHLEDINTKIERTVQERTAELNVRNQAMTLVLDHVDQGIFGVDLDGKVSVERSASVERLLGPVPADGMIASYIATFAPDAAAWFDVAWDTLRANRAYAELALMQLPTSYAVNGRQVELSFKLVDRGAQTFVLIVATDTTAQRDREAAETDRRELAGLVTRLIADRNGFDQFAGEIELLLEDVVAGVQAGTSIGVPIHTIKGSASMFGLQSMSSLCHQIEETIDAAGDISDLACKLVDRWRYLSTQLEPITSGTRGRIEVTEADLDELLAALRDAQDPTRPARLVESWRCEPVRAKLERLGDHARWLADKLGKTPLVVRVDCDRTRIPKHVASRFWTSLVHVVRNAVDHGIETPAERSAAGKTDALIALRAAAREDALVVEIEDHGRGIDWSTVAETARARGARAETRDELVDMLFRDGVSTADTVTTVSGRGIGLSAVREACREAGGTVTVSSDRGRGTTFSFTLPITV